VDPDWRGRGVGASLVRDRFRWAGAQGLERLYLITEIPAFFARFGYRTIERSSTPASIQESVEFARVCPETAPVMSLELSARPGVTREDVRDRYGSIARDLLASKSAQETGCCGPSGCGCGESVENPITSGLYGTDELAAIATGSAEMSLGCGNPVALAELAEGETVLDLGSGGGIDVLLSARRVGPTGKVFGVDMTDEMLELAREHQRRAGIDNVEFLKGEIENLPLPDQSVDVVISNCVINLSTDKAKTLREAFRVLKPGGRLAVADVVARGEVPEMIRRDAELWTGCIAGTLEEGEYHEQLRVAGFESVEIEPTRVYRAAELCGWTPYMSEELARAVDGKFMSAFVRARKPR
jgi:SAM-dependent methyltransferase